jgi:uracil phosphoribosyltransferase
MNEQPADISRYPLVHVSRHPLVKYKLTILRDKITGSKRFFDVSSEIAMLLAYESTLDSGLVERPVETPLAMALGHDLRDKIVLVPILRAGLGMDAGIRQMMPGAPVWHLGLRRDEKTLEPAFYYQKPPVNPDVDVCLILDPMLATGGTAVAAVDLLKSWGVKRIKFIGLIAAPEGVCRLAGKHPDVPIHLAALDGCLNDKGYIIPGLGDAGDRMFGTV